MAVALSSTLRALGITNMLYAGPAFSREQDKITTTATIFIGAIVALSSTRSYCVLCPERTQMLGLVLGYTNRDAPDTLGYYYRDYDNPFTVGKWVKIGILVPGQIVRVLSETNTTIAIGDPLKVVSGVMQVATTGDDVSFVSEEPVTAATNTRKYFLAKVVHA